MDNPNDKKAREEVRKWLQLIEYEFATSILKQLKNSAKNVRVLKS